MAVKAEDVIDMTLQKTKKGVQVAIHQATEWGPYFTTDSDIISTGELEFKFWHQKNIIESIAPSTELENYFQGSGLKWDYMIGNLKKIMGHMQFSFELVHLKAGPKMIINIMGQYMKGFVAGMALHRDFYLAGNGSGKICNASAPIGTTISVSPAMWFRPEMRLTFVKNGVVTHERVDIVEVYDDSTDPRSCFIDVGSGVDLAGVDTDTEIYMWRSYSSSFDRAPIGMTAHISDANPPQGTYQGKDRTSNPRFKAIILEGATPGVPENFTENRILALWNRLYMRLYNSDPKSNPNVHKAVTNPYVFNHILNWRQTLTQPNLAYQFNQEAGFKEGFKIFLNGAEVRFDILRSAPANQIMFPKKGANVIIKSKAGYVTPYGKRLIPMNDAHGYSTSYYEFLNTYCPNPHDQAAMLDVVELNACA